MAKWDDKGIPYDPKTGSVYYFYQESSYDWNTKQTTVFPRKPNDEFEEVLRKFKFHKGHRSGAHATCESAINPGRTYGVFLSDVSDMIDICNDGRVHGMFKFRKHGQSIGLILVKPLP